MRNYIKPGDVSTHTAPAGGFTSGVGYVVGDRFGVAANTVAAGVRSELVHVGVFEFPKLSTDVIAEGAKVYWDDTNKRVTVTATGNRLIGTNEVARANPSAFAQVRLDGVALPAAGATS